MKIIVEQVSIKASLFSNEPPARPGHVFVYEGKNNRYITIKEGQVLSRAEIRSNKIFYRYTVKKINQTFTSPIYDVPCQNLGRNFRFQFKVDLAVEDAEKVVLKNIEDLENYFSNQVINEFQPKIASYYFDQFNELKKDVVNFLHQTDIKSAMQSSGILVGNFTPTIFLSNEDFKYYKDLENINKEHEINKRKLESLGSEKELKQKIEIELKKQEKIFKADEEQFDLKKEMELDKLRQKRFEQLMELHKDDGMAKTYILQGDIQGLNEYLKQKAERQAALEEKKAQILLETIQKIDPNDLNYEEKLTTLLNANRRDVTPEPKKLTAGGFSDKWEYDHSINLDDEEL